MQLWDGCSGAEAKILRVTLVCAGCKLGAEGGRRVKSLLERNTTLTKLDLSCKWVIFGLGREGMGVGSRSRARCFLVCDAALTVSQPV